MALSRTNTVQVEIGEGSKDGLVAELGLASYVRPSQWNVNDENAAVGTGFSSPSGGTLVLNDQLITITPAATLADVVSTINAKAAFTGVVASIATANGQSVLKLTPRNGESVNHTSAFVDLNQVYGSVESHAIFMREYKGNGELTGRLLTDPQNSTARWFDLKKNAQRIGLILHDRDVTFVPLVETIPQGQPNAGRYAFVVLEKVSGQKSYIFDTALVAANQVLASGGSAFLIDLAHDWKGNFSGTNPFLPNGDLIDPSRLNQHAVGGDGRLNENIGLTSIHEIFVNTHNNILRQIQANLAQIAGNNGNNQALSGEELFQLAKLATENFYQHHVFQEYVRRVTPNLGAFAGPAAANNNNGGFNASILAEFASSAFRFGHSQLTETMALQAVDNNGLAIPGTLQNKPLLEAFLAPQLYTRYTAAEVAAGMSQQVGNATDEYITNTLRNALVGLPLDLAALNIGRGLDAGITPLHEARRQIQAFLRTARLGGVGQSPANQAIIQANNGLDPALASLEANLRPYVSWTDFGAHLLHPASLKGFIMAYARDAILKDYSSTPNNLTYWNTLQTSNAALYAQGLSSAADAAMASTAFMGQPYGGNADTAIDPTSSANVASGNRDFEAISLWLGGLAEAKTPGGMLGPTHDFIYAYQMQQLQRGDEAYYLSKLAATDLVEEIKGKTVADMVMAATGVKHLYHKIFAVNDADYERSKLGFSVFIYNNDAVHQAATTSVVDITGVTRSVGLPGYVGGFLVGNPGNYLDARGAFNPNGAGNASELFGGTPGVDKFRGLGGDDCFWGDAGADIIDGGDDNDFADGGTGNGTIYGGNGNDDMYGGEGADTLFGEAGADDLNCGNGNDLVSGGADNDLVKGQAGDDTLIGGQGVDTITGGGGSDRFVFDEALTVSGADQIRDFSSGVDKLVFDKLFYNTLTGAALAANQFLAAAGATTATTADQRFIYNTTNGDLRFDPDGIGVAAFVLI